MTDLDEITEKFDVVFSSLAVHHAVGCENMTILDKIIFVADAIEPNRTGSDADKARKASEP